jgi:hypothetical protein
MSSPSSIRSQSAESTGATVSTGEQIRTRRFARRMCLAIRRDSASPNPGVNHARILVPPTRAGFGSTNPLVLDDALRPELLEVRVKSLASSADSTIAITFSCRDHESSVQFVDPVHTLSPSRTTYLWCIRSGIPAIGRCGTPSDEISSTSGSGAAEPGSGSGARRRRSSAPPRRAPPRP